MRKQQRFRSDKRVMNTKIVNKTALSNQDSKRFRTFDGIITYTIGTNPFIVCESEMLISLKNKFNNDRIKLSDRDKYDELMNLNMSLYYLINDWMNELMSANKNRAILTEMIESLIYF